MVREPVADETGTYEELRADAVDPAAPVDPGLGHKPFLTWNSKKSPEGLEEWIATGLDNTVYKIKPQSAGTPPSDTGIIEVT